MTDVLQKYLIRKGWFKSRNTGLAQTWDGEPIPWLTYSAIQFLEPRIQQHFTVFEFGCGQSTLWWAKRVRSVVSCEHDRKWCNRFEKLVPPNVRLISVPLDQNGLYCRSAAGNLYDIIVIDGRDRNNCARQSVTKLSSFGVIIWDNTERPRYAAGKHTLLCCGFRELECWGLGPINNDEWCTSIFYRTQNCLGI